MTSQAAGGFPWGMIATGEIRNYDSVTPGKTGLPKLNP